MPSDQSTAYTTSAAYKDWQMKLKDLISVMDDLTAQNLVARKLRYTEVDIEKERDAGRLAPDELFIPQHIIDTNIRREQASYIQYVTQSPRAVILQDFLEPSAECGIIEHDVSTKLRFDGWQMSMYSCIDSMQQNGYGIMEIVQDQTKTGELATEFVQKGDFGFIMDTRNLQECEMISRAYYFSKTRLLAMCDDESWQFQRDQINKVLGSESTQTNSADGSVMDKKDKSLYKIQKVMFRLGGIVHVAWACDARADDWLRPPRPLYIGRREIIPGPPSLDGIPNSRELYETMYPYFLFPYLISENDTISQLKGRAYFDQDTQEATTSLMSSAVTAYRRASGLYFSKDVSDPNDDIMMQKNVFFKTGALINSKVQQFQLAAPGEGIFSAIQMMVSSNMQETSQVNFAAQNRKDSRKTATEIQAATQSSQSLSTVQVVLFSSALRSMYQTEFEIIQSRVQAGLIKVSQPLQALYTRRYVIKPSGDTDVIERQQIVQAMTQAWPVMEKTAAAPAFLSDLLTKMFPDNAQKYIAILQQQLAQQQSVQAQQQQVAIQKVKELAMNVVELSKHSEMFSDVGKLHALPRIQMAAGEIEQVMQQTQQPPQQQ